MVRKYEAGALRVYFKMNEQIHQLILAAARNQTLAQMQPSLSGRVRRARYMANMSPARWTRAVAERAKIFEPLAAPDGKPQPSHLKENISTEPGRSGQECVS